MDYRKKHSKTQKSRSDIAVQGTNDSSVVSKCSMAHAGYFDDEYIKYFVDKQRLRAPLINRNYFIRAAAIDYTLQQFLTSESGHMKQILSLGAGFDSTYFRLRSKNLLQDTVYYEIDFPDVVQRKLALIRKHQQLKDLVDTVTTECNDEIVLHSPTYKLIGADLTNCKSMEKLLLDCGIDPSLPTMLLSEVVITYIAEEEASKLIHWASSNFVNSMFVTYEQVQPHDGYGIVMCDHFKQIGSPLKNIKTYPDIVSHRERFLSRGWSQVRCVDMNEFYHSEISLEEQTRVNKIEPFDEFEEWHMTGAHYILLCAFKGSLETLHSQFLESTVKENTASTESVRLNNECLNQVTRYAHSTCRLANGDILVYGGFGDSAGQHRRLSDMFIFNVQDGIHYKVNLEDTLIGERMYHTCTLIDEDTVLICGGRTSPKHACGKVILLHIGKYNKNTNNIDSYKNCECCESRLDQCANTSPSLEIGSCDSEIKTTNSANSQTVSSIIDDKRGMSSNSSALLGCCQELCGRDEPAPRWRHTATLITNSQGLKKLVIFGGRNDKSVYPTEDLHVLDISTLKWLKVQALGTSPGSRHSHCAVAWGHNLVVTGGLDSLLRPCSTMHFLDIDTMAWSLFNYVGAIYPRYSHASCVLNNLLLLVGGVSQTCNPGIACADLNTGCAQEYTVQMQDPSRPFLMCNHTVEITEENRLTIYGGGGNCFSFGTHLNNTPTHLDISNIIK